MRRSDREIRDMDQIREVIKGCDCCRIAFPDENGPYIVPLNFAFTHTNAGRDVFYFHGAKEGRKHQLILRSPTVGFELDRNHAVKVQEPTDGRCDDNRSDSYAESGPGGGPNHAESNVGPL